MGKKKKISLVKTYIYACLIYGCSVWIHFLIKSLRDIVEIH